MPDETKDVEVKSPTLEDLSAQIEAIKKAVMEPTPQGDLKPKEEVDPIKVDQLQKMIADELAKLDAKMEEMKAFSRERAETPASKSDPVDAGGKAGGVQEFKAFLDMPTDELLAQPAQVQHQIKAFRQFNDDALLIAAAMQVPVTNTKFFLGKWSDQSQLRKAMDSVSAGTGLEWVPTEFSRDLYDRVRLQLKVAALFQDIPMPTDPFKLPMNTADTTAKLGSEATEPTETYLTTANATLDAKKLIVYTSVSYEAEEDWIIAALPTIRNNQVIALASGLEKAIINGDTTATHQDSNVTASDDVQKAWRGLRKTGLALACAKDLGSVQTDAGYASVRTAMGKYGIEPGQLAWIMSSSSWNIARLFTNTRTVNLFGPEQATILTGQLGFYDGVPVIVSEYLNTNQNATGVYDGSTTTKTSVLLVRKDSHTLGSRKGITVETDRDITKQVTKIVTCMRKAFIAVIPTTELVVGVGYNLTS